MKLRSTAIFLFVLAPALSWNYKTKQNKRRGERTNFEEDVRSRLTTFIIDDWLFEVIDLDKCRVSNRIIKVETGWPLRVSCAEVRQRMRGLKKCLIINGTSSKTLYSEVSKRNRNFHKYYLPDIAKDTKQIFIAVIQGNTCYMMNMTMHHTTATGSKCDDFGPALQEKIQINRRYTLYCGDADAAVPLHLSKNLHHPIVKWMYNCSPQLPDNVIVRKDSSGFDKLHFQNVSVAHAGSYTCAVTYKNMTRYFVQYDICIKPQVSALLPPSLNCSKSKQVKRTDGTENATLTCNGHFGTGIINPYFFTAVWTKGQNSSFFCFNPDGSNQGSRISCTHRINNKYNDECVLDPDFQGRRENIPATVTFQLHFRNIRENDLGRYDITLRTLQSYCVTKHVHLIHLTQRARTSALLRN